MAAFRSIGLDCSRRVPGVFRPDINWFPSLSQSFMEKPRSVVFTGHMIDLPDRPVPRFPQALERAARDAIRNYLVATLTRMPGDRMGFASAARGGDIVFHEQARDLGLETVIVLHFQPEVFEQTSIAGVPASDWVDRVWRLWEMTPEPDRVDLRLPRSNEAYAQCNAKIVELAAARGPFHLIALWDGKGGKTGGTADLVRKAQAIGDKPHIVHPADLL